MVDSNFVERLFPFLKNPGVEKERKNMKGKTGSELTETMKKETAIIEAGEGLRGAEGLVQNARNRREAARQKLEE